MFFAPTPRNHENPHFVASRALIKNRLGESSNLAHRGMHAKFQLIWAVRLVRAMGVVKIESSSYNWRKPVHVYARGNVRETERYRYKIQFCIYEIVFD